MTGGYHLRARHVIHTVGPVWRGGTHDERELLESCYVSSLQLARDWELSSIAFPSISTGVYGYPVAAAAAVAVEVMARYVQDFHRILACCFSQADGEIYRRLLSR